MKRILTVLVLVLMVSPAYAIMGLSMGIKGGVGLNADFAGVSVDNSSIDKLNLMGFQFKVATLPKIDFIFTAEYGWKKQTFNVLGNDVEYKVRDLALTASAVYPFGMPVFSPYVGVGVGTHSLGYDFVGPSGLPVAVPDDKLYMGYHIVGGIDFKPPVFPIGLTGEARYNWIQTEGDSSHYLSVTLGVNYNFL